MKKLTPYQLTTSIIAILLETVLLCKIIKVRQFFVHKFFFFYILAIFIPSLIILFFYKDLLHYSFHGQSLYLYFFASKDILHNLLKLGIIYMLYLKLYRPYPGARSVILALLCLTIPFLIYNLITLQNNSKNTLIWNIAYSLDSRIVIWLALIFIILSGGIYFFNLQIDRRLKYVLLGFLAYQAPLAIIKILADLFALSHHRLFSHINMFLVIPPLIIWIMAFSSFSPGRGIAVPSKPVR